MLRIKDNAYELIRYEIKNQKLLDFIIKNQWKEIEYEETPWWLCKVWLDDVDYVELDMDDKIFEEFEEYEEIEEELEEPKERLTTKQKNIMFVIVTITALAFFLWFKFWVKPLDENDKKYINGLKIDKSIYSFERDLTQLKFDLEDTIKLKEKQEKEIENIENSLKELREKK